MQTPAFKYWPFEVAPAEVRSPQEQREIEFLQHATARGFSAYQCGINDYGAKNSSREGIIIERSRSRWEVRLADAGQQALSAYVDDFDAASAAVCDWLEGKNAEHILAIISEHLIAMPGAKGRFLLAESVRTM